MKQFRTAALALGGALLAGAGAQAQDATIVCTNAGNTYQIGELACIAACYEQRRLARCDDVSGRGTWTYVSDTCPSAMINPALPTNWSEAPTVAVMSPIPFTMNSSAIAPSIARLITRRTSS